MNDREETWVESVDVGFILLFCVLISVFIIAAVCIFRIDLIVLYSVSFISHCLTFQVSLLLEKGPEPRIRTSWQFILLHYLHL
jgi:hypothetical protein